MNKIYYEKIGRRYKPVAEYDSDLVDSFDKGTHIVMTYPGGQSRRYNINPEYGPMIAAGRVAEDAICKAIAKASDLRPTRTPLTPAQQKAWKNLAKSFGNELCSLQGPSHYDIAKAAIDAMQEEADKLMKHEGVRKAYEQFLLMCELTKTEEKL